MYGKDFKDFAEQIAALRDLAARVEKNATPALITTDDAKRLLPSNSAVRKDIPLCRGVLDYFPLALAEVAKVSQEGNKQHSLGQPLRWVRDKSSDHEDCIVRHLLERGTVDTDGMRHTAKLAWRALALLQIELEGDDGTK